MSFRNIPPLQSYNKLIDEEPISDNSPLKLEIYEQLRKDILSEINGLVDPLIDNLKTYKHSRLYKGQGLVDAHRYA